MAEVIDYFLAQSFKLLGEQKATVTDATGTNPHDFGGGLHYRIFAAQTSGGAGTLTNPHELLYEIAQAFGPLLWTVTLRPSGVVRIQYDGAGTASVVWNSSVLRNILGFSGTLSIPSGTYVEGGYLPTHTIFATAAHDSGWIDEPARFSSARMPSGVVYGWSDSRSGMTRKLDLRLLPKDNAARAALIALDASTAPGSPACGLTSRRINPGAAEPGQAPPWGAVESIATGGGKSFGAMLGTFDACVHTPSGATFEHVYLTPACVSAPSHLALSVDGWDARRDLTGVELSLYAEETR